MAQHIALGKKGESLVAHYLEKQGFKIISLNFSWRGGEIDIIAQKNEIIACVEVKVRSTHYFNLSEIITPSKQRKIIKTALYYIAEHSIHDVVFRFDVALLEPKNNDFDITYIPNAFAPSQEVIW